MLTFLQSCCPYKLFPYASSLWSPIVIEDLTFIISNVMEEKIDVGEIKSRLIIEHELECGEYDKKV